MPDQHLKIADDYNISIGNVKKLKVKKKNTCFNTKT